MLGELVTVVTEDKVRLDGFYSISTQQQKNASMPADAAVVVHGLSGNFYGSRLLKHFAQTLLDAGINSLLVNTRGHDYLNSTPRMGQAATIGAAVEIVDECKYDLNAWVDFLVKQNNGRVMLLGHSLGAIKSLYTQAHMPHAKATCLAVFSATKLSYDSLLSSTGGERFSHWLGIAQQQVSAGNGEKLLYVDFPFPTWMSANAYLNKYGDGDKYNWLSFIDRIDVPTLAAFGELEMKENPAFTAMTGDLENIRQPNVQVDFIRNADHFYSACFDAVSSTLINWLKSIRP